MAIQLPALAKSISEAAKSLKTASESLASAEESKDGSKVGGDTPSLPEAADAAARARKSYDGLIRWILGVFTAVGLLIFGSIPFSNLEDVPLWDPFGAGQGLLLAGIGLIVVAWAATTGLEMQDASLGELKRTLGEPPPEKETAEAQTDPKAQERPWWYRFWLSIFPRKRAAQDLRATLYGEEKEAHLGPDITSVGALIKRIGDLEKAVKADETGETQETVVVSSVALKARGEQARAELEVTEKALTELRKQLENTSDNEREVILQTISGQQERYRNLLKLLPEDVVERSGETARCLREREIYLWHRSLLLDESAVSQLRGTFHVVRRWLALGAILTLLGGLMYGFALANPNNKGVDSHVLVTVSEKAEAWKTLERCRTGDGEITGLSALLLSSKDSDGLQNGPFTIVTIEPSPCAGTKADIGEGEGTYQLAPTATVSSSKTDAGKANTEVSLVEVTIKANSPAWRDAAGCRPANSPDDVRGLIALLRDASDNDALNDGPFTIETADTRCPGLALSIGDGDGSYKLR